MFMSTATAKEVLFDTNVLVYVQDKKSGFYDSSLKYHDKALSRKIVPYVSSQNILEMLSVITNPKKVANPLNTKIASDEAEKYTSSSYFKVIYPNRSTFKSFFKLIRKYGLASPYGIFDLFLVATMISNKVKTILTANYKDFELISEIEVIRL
jgi:predicted nucleic acid-binding protein